MSQQTDPELEALERQVQAAFRSTLPRAGFDRELWARIVPQRRRGSWLTTLLALPTQHPAQALAGATLAVLLVGVGIVFANVSHRPANGGASYLSAPTAPAQPQAGVGPVRATGAPSADTQKSAQPAYEIVVPAGAGAGLPNSAPIYSYRQPDRAAADAFAASLSARPRQVPPDNPTTLGIYDGPDFVLSVDRGSGDQEARYQIVVGSSSGPSGTDLGQMADAYLSQHGLQPSWRSNQRVLPNGQNSSLVVYVRLFDIPGGSPAPEYDPRGEGVGLSVTVTNGRVTVVSGPLPVTLSSTNSQLQSPGAAAAAQSQRGAQRLTVSRVTVGYLRYSPGPTGYYVPAYYMSGTNERGEPAEIVIAAVDLKNLH